MADGMGERKIRHAVACRVCAAAFRAGHVALSMVN
jgi:hypothetical protein